MSKPLDIKNENLWKQKLNLDVFNFLQFILLTLSAGFLLWNFASSNWKTWPEAVQLAVLFLLLGIIANALITGGMANVYDRLQARASWLMTLPFFLF